MKVSVRLENFLQAMLHVISIYFYMQIADIVLQEVDMCLSWRIPISHNYLSRNVWQNKSNA